MALPGNLEKARAYREKWAFGKAAGKGRLPKVMQEAHEIRPKDTSPPTFFGVDEDVCNGSGSHQSDFS